MLKKAVLLSITILLCITSFNQGVAVGEWKSYFPFRNIIDIVKRGDIVYGASENGIIKADYSDNSVEKLTLINSLSDNGVSAIAINSILNGLVVGYTNGNVDLIIENQTINFTQIKSSSIIGDKGIYHIYCKDNLAYVSCGFGIVVLDLSKREVKDTYIIGVGGTQIKINKTFIYNNYIYALTENGILKGDESNLFLADFSSWSKVSNLPLPNNEYDEIIEFNGKLIVNCKLNSTDTTFYLDGSTWQNIPILNNATNESFYVYEDKIIVNQKDTTRVLDTGFHEIEILTNYDSYWKINANKVIYDGVNYYVADNGSSIVQISSNYNSKRNVINAIYSNSVMDIEVEDGHLWGASGSVSGGGWNKTYNNHGVFHYNIKENEWTIYNGIYQANEYSNITDFVGMAVNPKVPTVGIGCSFSDKGIVEFTNKTVVNKYDSSNSTLKISSTHGDRFAVADAVFDEDNNLWALSSWADKPLHLKSTNGSWKSFGCGSSSKNIIGSKIMIDNENGYKWMIFDLNHLVVYNDNKTPTNETDDNYRTITSGIANGSLEGLPTCVVEDLDGEIWIGTNAGFYVIYNPSDIFESGDFSAQRIKIEQDGNVEYILGAEIITSITIDGGNRKWIGTKSSGVFVLSADGITQIHHFTTENSPILSNNIIDIAIDQLTGEVFMSTDKGLISFKGEATEGKITYKDIYAYPNPVKPGYQGKIAITNLLENSDVKITDISGNVVFVTKSEGGQAIWNGNNLQGVRVNSGIYLVFAAGLEGRKKVATKILFMK